MRERLVELARTVGRELEFYRLVAIDRRTPAVARLAIGVALAYAASPVDLIPDWVQEGIDDFAKSNIPGYTLMTVALPYLKPMLKRVVIQR